MEGEARVRSRGTLFWVTFRTLDFLSEWEASKRMKNFKQENEMV